MQKEMNDQMRNGNFSIFRRIELPKGKKLLPSVWQMKRMRDIMMKKVQRKIKYKWLSHDKGSPLQRYIYTSSQVELNKHSAYLINT